MAGTGNCSSLNCSYTFNFVQEIKQDDSNKKLCTIPADSSCTMVYQYYTSGEALFVEIQKDKICPEDPDILGLVLGVTGSIILAGLLMLIIWKLVTTIHDRREYAKFENERAKAKWHRGENPLYKPTVSTFCNPTYYENAKAFENLKQDEKPLDEQTETEVL